MNRKHLLIAAVLLLSSCAHQMSPSGGPEDKTGPYVISSSPAAGAVNVKQTASIVLTFTKWITPASGPKSVSVLPALDGGFKVRVSARRLVITPRKKFADSTTYHVVITSALQDFHNNPMTGSFSLVFSTGPTLDSGRIAGCVNDTARRPTQAIAALYAFRRSALSDSTLFENPDYLIQTDSAGFFSFSNIRRGTYRLIAFADQNGNRRLDPGTERAFAPLQRLVQVTTASDTLSLYPTRADTVSPHPVTARAPWSGAIFCQWSAPLDSQRGFSAPQWTIEPAEGKASVPRVRDVFWLGSRERCLLSLDGALAFAPYRLLATFSRQRESGTVAVTDSIRCNGSAGADTVRPTFIRSFPNGPLPLAPEIRLVFSEPVTAGDGKLTMADSSGGTIPLTCPPGYADTVTLSAGSHVRLGEHYRLVLLNRSFKDLAGNGLKPRDSLSDTAAAIEFSTVETDSLAIAVKGNAPCLHRDDRRVWRFLPFAGTPVTCRDKNGSFEFDSLPSGKGLIEYFIDANGNQRPDPGSLVPWIAPEPFSRMPDTIEARARWEVEGITLTKPCARCAPAPAAADSLKPQPGSPGRIDEGRQTKGRLKAD